MANTSTTTYMLLVLPTPEVQVGPDWAEDIVAAFERVDLHDHSEDNGVKVTPAGININDDLDIGSNDLENVAKLLLAGSSSNSTPSAVYRVGQDLYYNTPSGASIQITSGGAVNAPGSGSISASTPGAYPYTVLTSDAQKVLLVSTASARTLNLPAATNAMYFMVKDITGSSQTNNITVTPDGTDTIDGANTSFVLRDNYGSWGFVSDGVSAWYVV